jgi:hypothetical protein
MAIRRNNNRNTTPAATTPTGGGNLCPKCGGTLAPSKFKAGTLYCTNYRSGCKYQCAGGNRPAMTTAGGSAVTQFIPTPDTMTAENSAICAAALTDNNLLVEAFAGTGKTWQLVQLVRVFAQERALSVLCLAFAKRDQLALTDRVMGRAQVMTSNAAGYRILTDYARRVGRKMPYRENPTGLPFDVFITRLKAEGLVVQTPEGKTEWKIAASVTSAVLELVDKARQVLPLSAPGCGPHPAAPSESDYAELIGRFGIEIATDDLPEVLAWSAWLFGELANLSNLFSWGTDFVGQIFLPSYHNLKPSQTFDRVLVDEAQDQSFTTRRIAELHLNANGRIVAVGDRHQAIYGWRGADSAALEEMARVMEAHGGAPVRLPLTLCRRCASSIIATANNIVPAIRALPDAPAGSVESIPTDADFIAELTAKRAGLVLCRANAPAVSMCLRLLAAGVPAALVRSDIVNQLLKLIDKCAGKAGMSCPITEVLGAVTEWERDQCAKLAKRQNGDRAAQVVRDKAATIHALATGTEIQTAGDLKRRIDDLFPAYVENAHGKRVKADEVEMKERAARIVLFSTVHGAKGGEAPTVYLYSPDTYKNNLWDAVWSDATDRDNVLYVALTRAEVRLVFAGRAPTLARLSDIGGDATAPDGFDSDE